jgi:hypothetical protein
MLDNSEVEQGTAAWFAAKCGKVGSSRLGDVMSRVKPSKDNPEGYSQRYKKYMRELLIERLTKQTKQHFVNDAMVWGIEEEAYAAAAYEAKNGVVLATCGFFDHPTIPMFGASPDRLVIGAPGMVEIKDPTTGTHLDTLLDGTYDDDYKYQMAGQIECVPGREWVDFVSFDSRLDVNLRYFQERFIPEPAFLETLRAEVIKFLAELDELEARVRAYKGE